MLNDIQKEKLSDEELDSVTGGVRVNTLLFNENQKNYSLDDLVPSSDTNFFATDLLEKDPKFRRRRRRKPDLKKKGFPQQNGGMQSL